MSYWHCKLNELFPVLLPRAQLVSQQISMLQVETILVKSRTQIYFVQHVAATCNTEICCETSLARGSNTGNNSFNLQCNNVAKQVEQKCCPCYGYRTFTGHFPDPRLLRNARRSCNGSFGRLQSFSWYKLPCTQFACDKLHNRKGPVIRATFLFILSRNIVALKVERVVARITTVCSTCLATNFIAAS